MREEKPGGGLKAQGRALVGMLDKPPQSLLFHLDLDGFVSKQMDPQSAISVWFLYSFLKGYPQVMLVSPAHRSCKQGSWICQAKYIKINCSRAVLLRLHPENEDPLDIVLRKGYIKWGGL